jgi:hypothetical protein
MSALTIFDRLNIFEPPGPGPGPNDDAAMVQFATSVRALSPDGQREAFSFLVADPARTGLSGAARSDYLGYLLVAGAIGLAAGAGVGFFVGRRKRS